MITSTPHTLYICLHTSTPIYVLYMITYIYAHIPLDIYILLR
jgi:hypothetical protein